MIKHLINILYDGVLPVLFLWFLLRPIIVRFEKPRIGTIILVISAVSLTCKFLDQHLNESNEIRFNSSNLKRVLREIAYSTLQMLITSLWTILCSRWAIHSLYYLKHLNRGVFFFIRYFGLLVETLFLMVLLRFVRLFSKLRI